MGILTINEGTEFVDRIMDHADVTLTGGKYFLSKFPERSKIIELIQDIHMDKTLSLKDYNWLIEQVLNRVLGGAPLQSSFYQAVDYSLDQRIFWAFDYEMPKQLNHTPTKSIHIKILFKK